jgi:hypothetical protein
VLYLPIFEAQLTAMVGRSVGVVPKFQHVP